MRTGFTERWNTNYNSMRGMTEKFQIYMKNVSTKCVYFVGGGLNCGLFQGQESNGTTVWHHRRVWENVGNNREWVCSEGEDFSNSNKSAFRSSSGSTPLTVSVSQRVLPCYTRLKLCLVFTQVWNAVSAAVPPPASRCWNLKHLLSTSPSETHTHTRDPVSHSELGTAVMVCWK